MAAVKLVILFCILVQAFEVKCSPRIIGGSDAAPGAAPYMVSLRYDTFFAFCGGALINAEWVITARHCIDDELSPILVALGSNTLDPRNVVIRSKSFHWHPESDIGLVKLSQPVQFSNLIQPVNVPSSDVSPNTVLTVTGWGALKFDNGDTGIAPNNLQTLNVVALDIAECRKTFPDVTQVNDLCTAGNNGHGTCVGDSGAPLVANNEIHGIVSGGIPCAIGYPDTYARVFYHNDWIKETMERN